MAKKPIYRPTTTAQATPETAQATPETLGGQVATGTVAHDGTPAVIAPVASAALAHDAATKVVTGIPYTGVIRTTGASYPFKGIRGAIYNMLRDGMTVADFAKQARAGYRGGIEDVRIYLRKGLVTVHDATTGMQVCPPAPPAPPTV